MKFGDGVPRWARRRVERHMMRHGDGRIVRWMAFRAGSRRGGVGEGAAGAASAEWSGNVVPFIRRPVSGPGETAPPLDATGRDRQSRFDRHLTFDRNRRRGGAGSRQP